MKGAPQLVAPAAPPPPQQPSLSILALAGRASLLSQLPLPETPLLLQIPVLAHYQVLRLVFMTLPPFSMINWSSAIWWPASLFFYPPVKALPHCVLAACLQLSLWVGGPSCLFFCPSLAQCLVGGGLSVEV